LISSGVSTTISPARLCIFYGDFILFAKGQRRIPGAFCKVLLPDAFPTSLRGSHIRVLLEPRGKRPLKNRPVNSECFPTAIEALERALQLVCDVRFGSKADIHSAITDVC
jgi:hypothetical protein